MKDSEEVGKPIALTVAQIALGCTSALFLAAASVALLIEPFTFSKLMYGTLLGIIPALGCFFLSKRSPFSRYLAAIALASQSTYIFRFYEAWFLSPNSPWTIQDVLQNATAASMFFGVGAVGIVLLGVIYILLTNKRIRNYMLPVEQADEPEGDAPTPKSLFDGISDHEITNNSRDSVERLNLAPLRDRRGGPALRDGVVDLKPPHISAPVVS